MSWIFVCTTLGHQKLVYTILGDTFQTLRNKYFLCPWYKDIYWKDNQTISIFLGFIWAEIKQMWDGGFQDYIHDWWNLMDFVMNSLYLATISLKIVAYTKVTTMNSRRTYRCSVTFLCSDFICSPSSRPVQYSGSKPRNQWEMWHPTLVAEAVFAIANIFSSLRLISLFTANSHLGPLQISLGRMLLDILKFLFIYCLVNTQMFACRREHKQVYE